MKAPKKFCDARGFKAWRLIGAELVRGKALSGCVGPTVRDGVEPTILIVYGCEFNWFGRAWICTLGTKLVRLGNTC